MPYTPHTKSDIKDMLDVIGLENENDLFSSVPSDLRVDHLNLKDGLDEFSTYSKFKKLSLKNDVNKVMFMGGGYYDHIVPSGVDALAGRSEFYTAYTPYQAEASQGTLQSLYEFQSLICELTGMDVANASMYDGATALAESALMAVRLTKRNKILIDAGVNKTYIKVVQTYLKFRDIEVEVIDMNKDLSDFAAVEAKIDSSIAAYLFQNPNFFGTIQDFTSLISKLHESKVLAVMSAYPIALGMIKDPGSLDVDIVCGDGQCLGNYLNFGGPTFGFMATKQEDIRNLPGRIIGKTKDRDGKEMFVLTMQAREQHIRRQRATSNICSNQNLLALRSTMFMALIGKKGLKQMSTLCFNKSEYLKENLAKISGLEICNTAATFNEFIIKTSMDSDKFLNALLEKGFYAGINLSNLYENRKNEVLISVTEKRTKEELDDLIKAIGEVL
ncbi:MAG: aminomethyl-transferring glycine dehydrogenase subunit GcvPA [Campylobacteraceae bacterium]|nr:aminomethyl-transferring glycine dehydrogenase subunit GcvPA [Campylobacteraceae bacterium]